eukprot:TRINITY_DN7149_c0_g1_i1.p1 TRINITY_DN7149_c0_g1~~TRINITY_DN7149_c0_g1_i1.p1  ORF type:complete len:330 (+),score=70.72 TRINITY_DN7149_c0_g1_i1:2-991(+)
MAHRAVKHELVLLSRVRGLGACLSARLASLESASPIELVTLSPEEPDASALQRARYLVADPGIIASHLNHLDNLQWLQSTWAGVERIMKALEGKPQPSWSLTRFAGYFGPAMTQYILAHILAHKQRIQQHCRDQMQAHWPDYEWRTSGFAPTSATKVAVLGAGAIGTEVAMACEQLGMRVTALTRSPRDPVGNINYTCSFEAALTGQDYVVNLLPSTPATRGLISLDTLRHCNPKTCFINVGRGDVAASDGVWVAALDQALIQHAILDVFNVEPLPTSSPLWQHPQITITPHIAAVSQPQDVADIAIINFQAVLNDEPLQQQVSLEHGY